MLVSYLVFYPGSTNELQMYTITYKTTFYRLFLLNVTKFTNPIAKLISNSNSNIFIIPLVLFKVQIRFGNLKKRLIYYALRLKIIFTNLVFGNLLMNF